MKNKIEIKIKFWKLNEKCSWDFWVTITVETVKGVDDIAIKYLIQCIAQESTKWSESSLTSGRLDLIGQNVAKLCARCSGVTLLEGARGQGMAGCPIG